MDDILKRLGNVEAAVSDIKADVSGISATASHLATKAELTTLGAQVSAMESRLIHWFVGTAMALTALAYVIAKAVN
jgi:hypothetical protein